MRGISVKLEQSGRILIPAAIRKKLHLAPGSELILRVDGNGIRLGTREQALARVHQRLRKYIPEGRVLSQELLDDRRREAARENSK